MKSNLFSGLIAGLLLILPNLAAADYFRVGNGGEGVLFNNGLFCRDLYDYDLHKTAWVGQDADPLILKNIRNWNPLSLSEKDIVTLAQKLSDLNTAKDYLGDDILAAILYFNWQSTDQNLVLINPDESRREISEEQRVALANRFLQNILINAKGFQQLDSINKSALILHEVIYALMTVDSTNDSQKQSLSATRQVVASFYDQKNINTEHFRGLVDTFLNISNPAGTQPARLGQKAPDTSIALTLSNNDEIKIFLSYEKTLKEKNDLIKYACDSAFANDRFISRVTFEYSGTRVVSKSLFRNSNGIDQIALSIRYIPAGSDIYRTLLFSSSDCYAFFKL